MILSFGAWALGSDVAESRIGVSGVGFGVWELGAGRLASGFGVPEWLQSSGVVFRS